MLLDGALAVTTIGAEPAAVIAVVIGPAVERDSDAPTTTSGSGTGPSAETTAGGTTTTTTASTAGSTSTAVPSTSTATTGPSVPVNTGTVLAVLPTIPTDFDSDGLSAAEEAEFGTNPNLADTDGDSLSDREEVFGTTRTLPTPTATRFATARRFGSSNPTYFDTDDDGVDDEAEEERRNGSSKPERLLTGIPQVRVGSQEVQPHEAMPRVASVKINAGTTRPPFAGDQ